MNITERALLGRINRKLKPDLKSLRKARIGSRLEFSVGRYYVLDTYRNSIFDTHVDPVQLGRELCVLA